MNNPIIKFQRTLSRVVYAALHIISTISKTNRDHFFNVMIKGIKKFGHFFYFDIDAGPVVRFGSEYTVLGLKYKLLLPNDDSLYYVRETEETYLKPDPGDIVFDIGSHYGIYTLLSSQKVGQTGRVYAFEPNSKNFAGLVKNIALNNCSNVFAQNIGLSNISGRVPLYIWGDTGGHSIVFTRKDYVYIIVKTLDTFVRNMAIACNQGMLIKIDAEGAELAILQGSIETIKKFRPKLTIAAYHYNGEIEQIMNFLRFNAPFYTIKISNHFLSAIPKLGGHC